MYMYYASHATTATVCVCVQLCHIVVVPLSEVESNFLLCVVWPRRKLCIDKDLLRSAVSVGSLTEASLA